MRVCTCIFCSPSFELFNKILDIHKIQYAGQDNGGLQISFQFPKSVITQRKNKPAMPPNLGSQTCLLH